MLRTPKYYCGRLLMRSGVSHFMTLRAHDFRIRFHPSAMALAFFIDSRARRVDHQVITSLLSPGENYIDVGANIGTTAIPAAATVGPCGSVIAVEPHPLIASYLRENIALNALDNISVKTSALDTTHGTVRFTDRRADDTNSIVTTGDGIEVTTTTLDAVSSVSGTIALLKIDVEGAEMRVLLGGTETLRRTAAIYIEVADPFLKRLGSSAKDVVDFLSRAGFVLYTVSNDLMLNPVIMESLLQHKHCNILGLRTPAASLGEASTTNRAMIDSIGRA